jgi:hypothetical protein
MAGMGRPHAHHSRLRPQTGLCGRDNNSTLAIDGGRHARPWRIRGSSVGCAVGEGRQARVGRIAQVAGNEEMLVFRARGSAGLRVGDGDGRNWRYEYRRGCCRSVGDTRDIGDLDDVGSPSEDCRSNRVDRMSRRAVVPSLRECLLAIQTLVLPIVPRLLNNWYLPPRPDTKPPNQVRDDCDDGETPDNSPNNGTDVRWFTLTGGWRGCVGNTDAFRPFALAATRWNNEPAFETLLATRAYELLGSVADHTALLPLQQIEGHCGCVSSGT